MFGFSHRYCFICRRSSKYNRFQYGPLKHVDEPSIYGVQGEAHYTYHDCCLESVLCNPEQYAETHGMKVVDMAVAVEQILQDRKTKARQEIEQNQLKINQARALGYLRLRDRLTQESSTPAETVLEILRQHLPSGGESPDTSQEGKSLSRYGLLKDSKIPAKDDSDEKV